MSNPLKVLVAGCGNMGASHARAYHQLPDFEIVGLVSRKPESREKLSNELGGYTTFQSFDEALCATKPHVVSINTYPDTHAEIAKKSILADAHVFIEKPLATTVSEAQQIVELAQKHNRKMVVGYILRVHPAWQQFISIAKTLGKPLVMRMNLNQQSSGAQWQTHKELMHSMSPIVDCGVHYIDVMCQMVSANPVRVSAIGANLTDEISPQMYNYGHLQVAFNDGSVGWYEAGWGPMMSETAFFVKDVIGPNGCVSMIDKTGDSDDIDSHTQTGGLLLHHSVLDDDGTFKKQDQLISTKDEPTHDELCLLEQQFLLDSIRENKDLTDHMNDAINSLRVVLAADESFKTGKTITLV